MADIPRPHLNKIPGITVAKQESQIKDLTKLTQLELLDLRERECKLLANKAQLKRLPDKGRRIQDFYDKVVAELNRRNNLEEAASMFSQLNIVAKGEKMLNKLEWNGNLNEMNEPEPTQDVLDSDDESAMDPLRIIAQQTMHERRIRIVPSEPSLITEEDLKEIDSLQKSGSLTEPNNRNAADVSIEVHDKPTVGAEIVAIEAGTKLHNLHSSHTTLSSSTLSENDSCASVSSHPDVEEHVWYVVEKTEAAARPHREKFKPYKTTITNVHDPERERGRKMGKHWEITAATPPLIKHGGAQMLNLLDSVEIQSNYLKKLKELQEQQAAERLAMKLQLIENSKVALSDAEAMKINAAFSAHRMATNYIEGEMHEQEMKEVLDSAAGSIHTMCDYE